MRILYFALLITGLFISNSQTFAGEREITLTSLLREMTDRNELARFKDYKCLQASSYDRHSANPSTSTWSSCRPPSPEPSLTAG